MSFFDDIFGALTGQVEAAPYTTPDIGQLLGQSASQAASANLAYNQAVAPGLFDLQLGLESKYDPNIAALRGATSRSILDELNLGTSLPQEIQQLVTQNALQSAAGSGFGLSKGGRALVAKDLGLTGLDLGSRRRNEAAGYVQRSPGLNQLYQPLTAFSPTGIMGENLNQANIANQRAANDFYREEGNKISMFNTFGRVAGGVIGGLATGGAGTGLGMQLGGSLIPNPYRSSQTDQGAGSNLFSSILSPSGSGGFGQFLGGPQYGIGGGGGGIQQLLGMMQGFGGGGGRAGAALGGLGIFPAF